MDNLLKFLNSSKKVTPRLVMIPNYLSHSHFWHFIPIPSDLNPIFPGQKPADPNSNFTSSSGPSCLSGDKKKTLSPGLVDKVGSNNSIVWTVIRCQFKILICVHRSKCIKQLQWVSNKEVYFQTVVVEHIKNGNALERFPHHLESEAMSRRLKHETSINGV